MGQDSEYGVVVGAIDGEAKERRRLETKSESERQGSDAHDVRVELWKLNVEHHPRNHANLTISQNA